MTPYTSHQTTLLFFVVQRFLITTIWVQWQLRKKETSGWVKKLLFNLNFYLRLFFSLNHVAHLWEWQFTVTSRSKIFECGHQKNCDPMLLIYTSTPAAWPGRQFKWPSANIISRCENKAWWWSIITKSWLGFVWKERQFFRRIKPPILLLARAWWWWWWWWWWCYQKSLKTESRIRIKNQASWRCKDISLQSDLWRLISTLEF